MKDGAQCFTLVTEWLQDGRVTHDSRQQMDAETFRGLHAEVTQAAQETGIA